MANMRKARCAVKGKTTMGLNTPSDEEGELVIGPTDQGLVRIFISNATAEIPLDFSPDDAEAIAGELMAAASAARRK